MTKLRISAEPALKALALASLAALLAAALPSAAATKPVSEIAPVWRMDATGSFTETKALISLVPGGQAKRVRLTGLSRTQFFDFGVPPDSAAARAQLELEFTPSPSVLPTTSQLNVYLNGQLQQTAVITPEMIGKLSKLSVALNPKAIQTLNQITVEFIGHVQPVCENPGNEALWLDIGPASRLVLEKQRIRLANDIGRLPDPFVDTVSGAPTVLPMVFASRPSAAMKTAAAAAASWVGRITHWRGADFPVYIGEAPAGSHFIVFATNDARPDFLKGFPAAEGPQITVADAPGALAEKMLVISGRNEADLIVAARMLSREGNVMIGDTYKPAPAEPPARRKAYDAPRWINTDTRITFGDLAEYAGQLTSRGYSMPPVSLPVRFAPDLFMVDNAKLEMRVAYRATKPVGEETPQFRAFVNGFLLDSDTAGAKDGRGARVISLPGFYGPLFDNAPGALSLTPSSTFSFEVGYERAFEGGSPENCKSVMILPHQMEIDPASTLEISGLYHWVKMPDAQLFTQAGFPFTRYADLAETAILISDDAPAEAVRVMLNAVGRLSAITGASALHLAVTGNPADPVLAERDVLAVGEVPVLLTDIDLTGAEALQKAAADALAAKRHITAPAGSVIAEGIAAITGFRSPYSSRRAAIALLSEGEGGAVLLGDALVNPQSLGSVSGTSVIIAPSSTVSFSTGDTWWMGDLPWKHQIWMKLSGRPGWIVVFALISAVTIGFALFIFMRRWVGRRA